MCNTDPGSAVTGTQLHNSRPDHTAPGAVLMDQLGSAILSAALLAEQAEVSPWNGIRDTPRPLTRKEAERSAGTCGNHSADNETPKHRGRACRTAAPNGKNSSSTKITTKLLLSFFHSRCIWKKKDLIP